MAMVMDMAVETGMVLAALDAGCGLKHQPPAWHGRQAEATAFKRNRLRSAMFAVLQELPDDMTVAELRDFLEPGGDIAQGGG